MKNILINNLVSDIFKGTIFVSSIEKQSEFFYHYRSGSVCPNIINKSNIFGIFFIIKLVLHVFCYSIETINMLGNLDSG